jgi:opacity protein-like surface antigen
MPSPIRILTCFCLAGVFGSSAFAQRQELGLTLGALFETDRGGGLTSGAGTGFQANYGFRLAGGDKAALFLETHFLASPLREVETRDSSATANYASLYVTPGLRIKFAPNARISPYVAVGGGLAWYEQSREQVGGGPNSAPRNIYRGAFQFGGGVDVKVWRFLSLRAEVRDFYTGSPAYNVAEVRGGQHNVVAGGGFSLRF